MLCACVAGSSTPVTRIAAFGNAAANSAMNGIEPPMPMSTGSVPQACRNAALATSYTGPVYDAARAAFRQAWGAEPVEMGMGGSIPFIAEFAAAFPKAAILVTGVEDPATQAHSINESLDLGVLERAATAEALLLAKLG